MAHIRSGAEAPLPQTIAGLSEIPVGEELEYQVSWWGAPVGTVLLKSSKANGLIQLECTGRSNRTLDAFYPVRVKLTSWVDRAGSPQKFNASVKRRRRLHESTIAFDHLKGSAYHELPKGKTAVVSIHPQTQDGLSLLYHARMLPFESGQTLPLEVTADGKNWSLTGKVLRSNVVTLARLGSFSCIEGEVELSYPVPFFQGAKARIWFTEDSKRIPLLAKIHSRIGPVTAVLIRLEPSQVS
ncbi:MAG: DUF3108 domain-containing protein [Candidatus Omnitrophica bacterium]|nr:DUF3108 domain-containing protein [Candidatus Omnitrophota bacterium]